MFTKVLSYYVSGSMLSLVLATSSACAATITFDNLPTLDEFYSNGTPNVYVENSITATATGDFASHNVEGAVHLDDAGTGFPWLVSLSTGDLFDALSFDVLSGGFAYGAYPNILAEGFLGSVSVATSIFSMNAVEGGGETFAFGQEFGGIDLLQISAVSPLGGGLCAPCGHFNLDAVVLGDSVSPIPLPATFPLMGLALAGMGVFARGRRKKRT